MTFQHTLGFLQPVRQDIQLLNSSPPNFTLPLPDQQYSETVIVFRHSQKRNHHHWSRRSLFKGIQITRQKKEKRRRRLPTLSELLTCSQVALSQRNFQNRFPSQGFSDRGGGTHHQPKPSFALWCKGSTFTFLPQHLNLALSLYKFSWQHIPGS